MKKFYNTDERYGFYGPFEAESKEELVAGMLPTFTEWAEDLWYKEDETDMNKTAFMASAIEDMKKEFSNALEERSTRYDIRVNNIFWRTVEGNGIEDAIHNADLYCDIFLTNQNSGSLVFEIADLAAMAENADTDNAFSEDYMSRELKDDILERFESGSFCDVTYGPEE